MSAEQGEMCRIVHSCGLPQLNEAFGWKSVCGRAYNLKGIMRKIYFLSFVSFPVAHFMGDACGPRGGGRR